MLKPYSMPFHFLYICSKLKWNCIEFFLVEEMGSSSAKRRQCEGDKKLKKEIK